MSVTTDRPPCSAGSDADPVPGAEIYTPAFRADPFPTYARLRAERPVVKVRTPRFDSYLVTRYHDARAALSDPRLSKDLYRAGDTYLEVFGMKARQINTNMLNSDPPEHTRLRRLVSQAFTPRRIEAMRPRVEQVVETLLDRIAPTGRTDFVDDVALRLPLAVIGDLLGIPPADHEEILRGTQVIRTVGTGGRSPQEDRAAIAAAQEGLHAYFAGLVAAKRRAPADDLVSSLIAARDEQGRLSEAELVSTSFLLLFAGYQTTSDFLGNAVVALLTHPEQLELLRREPERLPDAVEELLRFDCSVPVSSFRFATEDMEIGGVPIPAGSIVTVVLSSANHDPAVTPDPERLDLTRVDVPHLAFGHGLHYCLGTALARMEATTALRRILVRLPDLRLDVGVEELLWLPAASAFRGLLELPLRFTPVPRT
ncbi:cytochrome P450 family protein [Trujillonella endophytica]|uniref:Cytochrome P450 n=1 Tax=Trujillonella endophytica TaxID=673521 RepID=A0A1H8WE53_9ACTN|nr:cytochrome P450 [Trujillella endophytica]SEP25793.1 Cytochrome P450 [Trujillella endophytica]